MEYHVNTDFNLHGAIDSTWHRINDQKNSVNWRHEEAKKAIRATNEQLLREDLNTVLPPEVQRTLNLQFVPALDIYESNVIFDFNGTNVSLHRTWLEKTGLYWHISAANYNKICLSDNLQSELMLLLATLKNNQQS